MTMAWGVRGPVKFDTYKHLRGSVSRIVVCMPVPKGSGSLSILERQYVENGYLKWRSARHPGPFFNLSLSFASPSPFVFSFLSRRSFSFFVFIKFFGLSLQKVKG